MFEPEHEAMSCRVVFLPAVGPRRMRDAQESTRKQGAHALRAARLTR